jgi:hypothetical protein
MKTSWLEMTEELGRAKANPMKFTLNSFVPATAPLPLPIALSGGDTLNG